LRCATCSGFSGGLPGVPKKRRASETVFPNPVIPLVSNVFVSSPQGSWASERPCVSKLQHRSSNPQPFWLKAKLAQETGQHHLPHEFCWVLALGFARGFGSRWIPPPLGCAFGGRTFRPCSVGRRKQAGAASERRLVQPTPGQVDCPVSDAIGNLAHHVELQGLQLARASVKLCRCYTSVGSGQAKARAAKANKNITRGAGNAGKLDALGSGRGMVVGAETEIPARGRGRIRTGRWHCHCGTQSLHTRR
jgi:hypothetical protein